MRVRLNSVSPGLIRQHHVVVAVDPNKPDFSASLMGEDFAPPFVGRNSPAFEIKVLEIEIDSTSEKELGEVRLLVANANVARQAHSDH